MPGDVCFATRAGKLRPLARATTVITSAVSTTAVVRLRRCLNIKKLAIILGACKQVVVYFSLGIFDRFIRISALILKPNLLSVLLCNLHSFVMLY